MSKILYRWRRWIIFGMLVAATWGMWWLTEPRPTRSWSYDDAEIDQGYALWLESISPDERWLVIRRRNPQKEQFLDFIDLRSGRVERTWNRSDTDGFGWDGSKLLIAYFGPNMYVPKISQVIDAKKRYVSFDPQTGEEKEIAKEEIQKKSDVRQFSGKLFLYGDLVSDLKVIDARGLRFHGIPDNKKQSYTLRITQAGSDELIAQLEIPFHQCVRHGNVVGEVIPQHPWLVFEGAYFLDEWCPGLSKAMPWLTRFVSCHHELRLIDWTTGKSNYFYASWNGVSYLVSSQGFFLHAGDATKHIIEFWPWPVARRNWWWLLAPWGCALLLWTARRAMTRNNRVAVQ